jgi:hypothetical protein
MILALRSRRSAMIARRRMFELCRSLSDSVGLAHRWERWRVAVVDRTPWDALRPAVRWIVVLGALSLFAAQARGASPVASPPSVVSAGESLGAVVPVGLMGTLSQWSNQFRAVVAHHPRSRQPPVFGGDLLVADSNRGAILLDPATLGWVNVTLDRFRELGMRGVTVGIGYPVLVRGVADQAKYVAFYRAVARAVHRHGMQLDVEQDVTYNRSVFSPWQFNFNGLTLTRFTAQQHQMAQTIIDAMHPDYLTILHEPDTFALLSGLAQFNSPPRAARYVENVISGLRRHKTLVGAGSGTWSSPEFIREFARTRVDYIDLHVYWSFPQTIQAGYQMARLARLHHKPVIMDEAWLYKSTGVGVEGTVSLAGWETVFRRDVFDVFAPLDAQFLTNVTAFARSIGARYLSPFWSNQFFAYVPYNAVTQDLSYQELLQVLEPEAAANAITTDKFSATGQRYREIIRSQSRSVASHR